MENQIKVVVFKSKSLNDITMIVSKGYWEHTKTASKLEPGMQVYVIPSKSSFKDNSSTPFAVLATAKSFEEGDDKNWEDRDQEYNFRIYLEDIYLVPFSHIEKLMPSGKSASSIRYID